MLEASQLAPLLKQVEQSMESLSVIKNSDEEFITLSNWYGLALTLLGAPRSPL